MRALNLIGQQFGRLQPIRRSLSRSGKSKWLCRCDCGSEISVMTASLTSGATRSCGCLRSDVHTKHGATIGEHLGIRTEATKAYRVWMNMKTRCYDPTASSYDRYGGRGIAVCARWRNSFADFYDDMGERPPGHTIERIDNDGNYEPSNCRWATPREQSRNKSNSILLVHEGELVTAAECARSMGLTPQTIYSCMARRGITATAARDLLAVKHAGKNIKPMA